MEPTDFDLRPYVMGVLRRWHWLITAMVLTALVAGAVSLVLPKKYAATAPVLIFIRQTGSELSANTPLLSIETIDVESRRQGLLALATSETVETQLPADVVNRVAGARYRPGLFLQREQISASAEGDLIKIQAVAPSSQQAKALADAWATTYVAQVQKLYTDEHSSVQLAGDALAPLAPISPDLPKNIAAGAFVGLLVGIILAFISEFTGHPVFAFPGGRRNSERTKPRVAASR
ncbi:MAG: Wzz/FepE/Etk N-terminal domain-containing protein [Chloroflexota bacterium]|nr:Wzz/FepE/Etk N-terminal domain-containing protein [Chloroflexota bacterium]